MPLPLSYYTSDSPGGSTAEKKFRFNELSTDLKAHIVDKISRPSDLKNLCLVNKELHAEAVKPLYRTVSFDIGSANDHRLSAFLSPKNIGLKHVKQLRLYLANVRGDSEMQMQQANVVSKMIFEFLPEDTLEEFRCGHTENWCPWKKFSTDTLLLLYRKQRKMKWLEVMDLDRDILPELKKNEKMQKELFQHTRRLALYPENRESLRLCQFYVQKTADVLEDLNVHTSFHESLDHRHDPSPAEIIDARELNDSATQPGLLTRTIFGHMLPFDKCEPFKNLRVLRLQRVNLRYCADTWCKAVSFTNIETLRVLQCPGADALLAELSKARNLPKQLGTFELQHKDNEENEALIALDGFLCLASGLQVLIVDLERVSALPAAASIARHGKTLEVLNAHCSRGDPNIAITSNSDDNDELVWDTEDFEKICTSCTSLEQISCAWPQTSLIRSPSAEWVAFERACGSLKQLVTLQISTWPTNKPSSQSLPLPIYQTLLQALAQRGFEKAASRIVIHTHTDEDDDDDDDEYSDETRVVLTETEQPSKLRLIAFGVSDVIYEREESKKLQIYYRSISKTAEGKDKIHAIPITWSLRQYIEPRSEVLDTVLFRDVKGPPCRENDHRGGSLRWGGDDDEYDSDDDI